LKGKSTSKSPPIPPNIILTLTEYETITPRRSFGSPVSAIEELARFVSSRTLKMGKVNNGVVPQNIEFELIESENIEDNLIE